MQSFNPGLQPPCPLPVQSLVTPPVGWQDMWLEGRIYCRGALEEMRFAGLFLVFSQPLPSRVFSCGERKEEPPPTSPRQGCLLQLQQMFLGVLASHRSVGAKSPCSPGILG